jgi:hypothetical protein|tara:strand:- start:195 stop:395 length:201 start_codon:yes stop_codon:yes gene_type:complete
MEDNYVENLNKLRELAESIKSLDILDPTSKTIMLLTEMVQRAKLIPELEMVDNMEKFELQDFEAEA